MSLPGLAIVGIVLALGMTTAVGRPQHVRAARAHTAKAPFVCSDPYPSQRDPSNPLMLRAAPGPDPLTGATMFVDGPRHGAAAGAIATLMGLNPMNFADDVSWVQFQAQLSSGSLAAKLRSNPALAFKVDNLSKIASEEEAQRLSAFSAGGSPAGVENQTIKILCHNLTAEPGSIPILDTYFLHPALDGSATRAQVHAATSLFKRRVNALARGIARRPAVVLLELDGIGSSGGFKRKGSLGLYEGLLRYEAKTIGSLPHTVVYMEGGYSDGNSPRYTARVLNAAGVKFIRGFWTNDTHLNWTINEAKWGEKISRMTHGAHFVINTGQNGNGPKRNPHPTTQGNEDLCNPPGRALGPRPTANTGLSQVDAFVWSSPPGNSSGPCNGGTASGTFDVPRAIDLAAHANGRLGPNFPSQPY